MRRKRILMLIGSVCLALMLVVPLVASCGPALPEEAAEEIAALESKLAAEKARVASLEGDIADLEDEIAELRAPGEVQKWLVAPSTTAGATFDTLYLLADYLEEASNGRIVIEITGAGAICAIDEQLDAVSENILQLVITSSELFEGKVPVAIPNTTGMSAPQSVAEHIYLVERWEDGRYMEILREGWAEYGDVYLLGNNYFPMEYHIFSTVPLYGVDDLKGLKFRGAGTAAKGIASMGVATCYVPGSEIYTSLATGVFDAAIYGGPIDNVGVSFHEVTSYWVRKPVVAVSCIDVVLMNGTTWKELPDDLKAIVKSAQVRATQEDIVNVTINTVKAWKFVEDYGIEIVEWPDAECAKWRAAYRAMWDEVIGDPRIAEIYEITKRFMIEFGYWE